MPRTNRVSAGDVIYHVINRANARQTIFKKGSDYQHFEKLLKDGLDIIPMRILSYCIMPNHWHLLLYPTNDGDMSEYMRWLTTTHVLQLRSKTKSMGHGHLYQGTYKSFPVETSEYLLQLILYIEQNPMRAKLVSRAEDWQWGSLWRRENGRGTQILSDLPIELPDNYLEMVNQTPNKDNLQNIRTSVVKGRPYGSDKWVQRTVKKYGLESTMRRQGRPKKQVN